MRILETRNDPRTKRAKASTRVLTISLVPSVQFIHCWLFPLSLLMPSSIQPGKLQINAMKAYRKQRQYIYHHCQLSHVTHSCAVIVGVCILMLPMLELATEHVQLATTYYMDHINHVHHVT